MSQAMQTQMKAPPAIKPVALATQSGLLQRQCACGGSPGVDGECAECRAKRLSMQRQATSPTAPSSAVPPIVHDVLRSPGQPLDIGTRTFMEPRFGHDFSSVRVHTDTKAAESARAVNALAYTVGSNVVFGSGQYSPGTSEGKRLMAHELTHVVQQGSDISYSGGCVGPHDDPHEHEAETVASIVSNGQNARVNPTASLLSLQRKEADYKLSQPTSRKPIPTLGTELHLRPPCSLEQIETHEGDIQMALQWLNIAINRLNTYIALPLSNRTQYVAHALDANFNTHTVFYAELIRDRLLTIEDHIKNETIFMFACASKDDKECGTSGAYTTNTNEKTSITWCPSYFRGSTPWRVETVIHEAAHAFAHRVIAPPTSIRQVAGQFVTDRAYAEERMYARLKPEEAMDNADSYAYLTQDLSTNPQIPGVPKNRPKDTLSDCSPASETEIRYSIALAEKWNRNAVTALADAAANKSNVTTAAYYKKLIERYFGIDSYLNQDDLLPIYKTLESKLHANIAVKCESEGGLCTVATGGYWGADNVLHICPLQFADIISHTKMIYELGLAHFTNVAEGDRKKYADIAFKLTEDFWPLPSPLPSGPFPTATRQGQAIG